jgi:hypothetical protein
MNKIRDTLLLVFLASLALRNVSLGPVNVTQAMVILCFLSGVFIMFLQKPEVTVAKLKLIVIFLSLPILYSLVDVLNSAIHDSVETQNTLLKARVGTVVTFLVPVMLYRPTFCLSRVNQALVLACILSAITTILTAFGIYDFAELGGRTNKNETISIIGDGLPRASGILSDFGDIAILFAFAVPWVVLVPRKFLWQLALVPVVGLLVLGGFLPLSRNVWLISTATLLLSLIMYQRMNSRRKAFKGLAIGLAAFVGVGVLLAYSPVIIDTMISMRAASSGTRALQYQGAIAVLSSNVLFGSGVERCIIDNHPVHNAVLLASCRTGLAGGIPFVGLYVANFIGLGYAAFSTSSSMGIREWAATVSFFISFCGFSIATMLFPGGASSASEIFWGLMGLFSAVSISALVRNQQQKTEKRATSQFTTALN